MLTGPDEHLLALEVCLRQITNGLLCGLHDHAAAASDTHRLGLLASKASLLSTHCECHCASIWELSNAIQPLER
jgi:hypothetical protein